MIFCPLARWTLVSATLPLVDSPGDAELISAVRGGDADAYGELFSRHVEAARRLGRQLVSGPDVDDLVAEAFAKVFVVLRRGGGPDLAFRAYLLTAVRRLHVDRIRAASRLHTTDDLTPFDAGVPFRDTAVEGFENATAARAFASLPERWQLVLWHTEVEGQKPADVGAAARHERQLGVRARLPRPRGAAPGVPVDARAGDRGPRVHAGPASASAPTSATASRVATGPASRRTSRSAAGARPIYLELGEVNANLSGLLAPVLLGGAAAAYVASSGSATSVGLVALLDRARELALTHAPATAAVGVGAGALVVGGLFLGLREPGPDPRPAPEASGPGDVRVAPPAQPDRARAARRGPPASPSSRSGGGSPTGPPRAAGRAPAGPAAAARAAPVTAPAPAPARRACSGSGACSGHGRGQRADRRRTVERAPRARGSPAGPTAPRGRASRTSRARSTSAAAPPGRSSRPR